MVKGFVNYLKEEKATFALSLGMVCAGIVIQNMLTVVCGLTIATSLIIDYVGLRLSGGPSS